MILAWILFGISAVALAYTYFGYPLLLSFICAGRERRQNADPDFSAGAVSVVVCVRNAGKIIEKRISNLLAQTDLPTEYEIIIASDGSTDETARVVGAIGDPRVKLMDFKENRGKAAVLNEVIPRCSGRIVVLGDARQEYEPSAISSLCRCFSDPEVGAVSGELVFRPRSGGNPSSQGIATYWQYEKAIRKMESCIDSTSGCTGAIYAIRRDLFRSIDVNLVLDDVAIPMLIMMQGKRIVFDEEAVAYDEVSTDVGVENRRKVRTLAGNLQLCAVYPQLLNPLKNRIFFQFVSHKLMRLACPWFLIVMFASSVYLSLHSFAGGAVLGVQVLFYLLALHGVMFGGRRLPFLFSVPMVFTALNWSALAGTLYFASGKLSGRWEPTE